MKRFNGKKGFLLGALFGSLAAGVSALLFAPKAGKELRNNLWQKIRRK